MENQDNEGSITKQKKQLNRILLISIIGIFLIFGLNLIFGIGVTSDIRGTFGDMFGASNTLFSGFALIGIIYALLLQRIEFKQSQEELKLQRQELALQREIQEATRKEFEEQNLTLMLQRFESSLFKLFEFHDSLVLNFVLSKDHGFNGIKYISGARKRFIQKARSAQAEHEIWGEVYRKGNSKFKPYIPWNEGIASAFKKKSWKTVMNISHISIA